MQDVLNDIRRLTVSQEISPHDVMFDAASRQHYLYVGRSSFLTLWNIHNIRLGYPGAPHGFADILDFGCGHGRVHRWLRAGFPDARLHVTDYDATGVRFCVETFGAHDTHGELPESSFDLIWLGSVFTHLPKRIVTTLLQRLTAALRPNGVLVFTTQGRFSIERMAGFDWDTDPRGWMHYALSREAFERVAVQYGRSGYGYVDYPGQTDYGVCIARPEWYARQVLASPQYTQILFQEKGFDNHQDVSAFLRADITDGGKGALWA